MGVAVNRQRRHPMVDPRSTSSREGPWPGECRGAVSLTFDDGMRSQLETAIPLLDEHGLQATFYLNPPRDGDEDDWRARAAPLRAAPGRGEGNWEQPAT